MKTTNWEKFFLIILILSVMFFSILLSVRSSEVEEQVPRGKWITYFYQIDEDTLVYYRGYVKENGVSEFNLIEICSEIEKKCRKPYSQEIEQDRYIPQSQIN